MMRRVPTCLRGVLLALIPLVMTSCSLPFGGFGGYPSPIAYRQIDLAGYCSQTDEDGFREQATLRINANQVQALNWQLWVGKRGSCRFNLAEFHQTRWRPQIELQANDGSGCKLLIWQDPRRVTLAHANCASRCTGGIDDEAWPVMFDPSSGQCSAATRR